MKTLKTSAVILGIAVALVVAKAPDANAQTPKLWPPAGGYSVPKLGFQSFFNGNGEQVTNVFYGSRAAQMGLEPGDVIVAVSGRRLGYPGAWHNAMAAAAAQGNVVLAIVDWRTGGIAYRRVSLGYGSIVTTKGRP